MKKGIFTLFALMISVAVFAQSDFNGGEFNTMTPEENAKAYTEYLTKTYNLSQQQATKIQDIRLKSAQHVALLDKAIANGESRKGYEVKRDKIIAVGINKVLNQLHFRFALKPHGIQVSHSLQISILANRPGLRRTTWI